MQTQLTEVGRFERMLTLSLDEAELDSAKDAAARKLSKEMKIKGFRPGKAPRAVVERMVGASAFRSEAIDEALPTVVGDALREQELTPATTPVVEAVRDRDEGGVEIDVKIALWPTVDAIPDFSGRKIEVELPEVLDSEVDDQVDRIRSQFAELEDVSRAAGEGDYVTINVTALDADGPIPDASADDLVYEVGSESFFGGLDELVAGASAGDIRKGPGFLPPGFIDREGEVELSVLVKGVKAKKLPEVTDEWVSDITELESIEELRSQLHDSIYAMKLSAVGEGFREQFLEEAVAELEVEVPDQLVEAELESTVHNLAHSLEARGIDFENYLRITGQSQDEFLAELRTRSATALKTRLLLEAVAERDGIEIEDAELHGAIAELARSSGQDPAEVTKALAESGQVVALAGDILRRKALNHLLDQVTPVDANGAEVDLVPPGFEAESSESSDSPDSVDSADSVDTDDSGDSADSSDSADSPEADDENGDG